MTDTAKADLDALEDLVQSRGFHLYGEMVRQEIHERFMDEVLKQFENPDPEIARIKALQVRSNQKAGERWLAWPKIRIEQLRQAIQTKEREQQVGMLPGRRPAGL